MSEKDLVPREEWCSFLKPPFDIKDVEAVGAPANSEISQAATNRSETILYNVDLMMVVKVKPHLFKSVLKIDVSAIWYRVLGIFTN